MPKYKYKLLKDGELHEWSGVFKTKYLAEKWYNKHGKEWERKGRVLKRVLILNTKEKEALQNKKRA